jgi:PAS domain S-box-containing protein
LNNPTRFERWNQARRSFLQHKNETYARQGSKEPAGARSGGQGYFRERLNQAVRIAGLGIWEWNIQTDQTIWEGEMFRIYGISPETFTGKGSDYIQFTRSDYRETQVRNIQLEIENGITEAEYFTGIPRNYHLKELCIVRPDGSECFTLGDAVCIVDAAGKPIRMIGVTFDITERKLAEARIQESETALRKAQGYSHVGSWKWDIQKNQLEWSDEVYRIFGIDPQKFSGFLPDVIASAIHPEDREKVEKTNKTVIEENNPVPIEYRVIWPDGSVHVVWAEAGELIQDKLGNPIFLSGIVQDITWRKQAELAHREAEDRYRSLAEATFEAILITEEGRIVDANHQLTLMWGYSLPEILGKDLSELVIPEERDVLRQVIAEGKETIREYCCLRKDGTQFFVEAHGRIIEKSQRRLRVTSIRNITERKQAEKTQRDNEERFKILVEQAPVAIMMTRKGLPIYGNRALIKMLEVKNVEEFISRSVFDYFAPEHQEESKERSRRRAQGLHVAQEIESTFQKRDGTQFPVTFFTSQIQLSDGPAIVAFITDISERKQAREQLESSLQQLHGLSSHLQTVRENERASIAREIHDELGQALTGLKMELFWLKSLQGKENDVEYARLVEEKLTSAMKDVDNTINVVRNISTSLRPSILDNLGLVPALEWLAHDFEVRAGIPCVFKARLRNAEFSKEFTTAAFRICQESLTNVARHAHASRVMVNLHASSNDILLEVEDNGQGITEEQINRGDSLGILGMKERAYAFNGTVELKNPPTRGTRVTACFPKATVFLPKK